MEIYSYMLLGTVLSSMLSIGFFFVWYILYFFFYGTFCVLRSCDRGRLNSNGVGWSVYFIGLGTPPLYYFIDLGTPPFYYFIDLGTPLFNILLSWLLPLFIILLT